MVHHVVIPKAFKKVLMAAAKPKMRKTKISKHQRIAINDVTIFFSISVIAM